MNEVMKMSRKALTAAVVAATIAWSVSLSAFLAPFAAQAATAGSLVKASLPAVYYVGQDGKRYVFPNEKTYKTWYADFSSVVTITDSELAAMPIGGNVTYKPGVKMVKITTSPVVYTVDAHGNLRAIASESVATALYGANWNHMIDDVPDAFFTNYTLGSNVSSASDFSPATVSAAASSINSDKNLGSATTISGSLSASLSSGQPAGGTLPKGATGVNVLKLDVHNGSSSAASLDSLTVHRTGAGAPADVSNMYVYAGNNRVTTGRTVNTSTNDAAFSGLNLSLAAGETKSLWIAVDFSTIAGASNVNSFSITSLMSGSALASGLPLSGPSFTMAGTSAGSVKVTQSGTITNPKSGQMAAKVAQFTLQAGSSEDLTLQRVSLYQSGNLSSDKISNLALKQAGLTIATVSSLNSKTLAVFALANPITIAKGDSRVFEVFADISGAARAGDTLNFYVDQTTDVLATGNTFGYGVVVGTSASSTPTGTYDGSAGSSSSTIDAGQLTLSFNGPASKDVAANSKNVELFNFTMAAQANLEVKKMHLLLDGNGVVLDDGAGNARLTNIQVIDTATGAAVMGPKDANQGTGYIANSSTTSALDFNDVFDLSAGSSRTFKVTANIANTTTIGSLASVKLSLSPFVAADIRNLDSSTNVDITQIVPNSAIAGNLINLKAPTLVVSAASTPVAQTYIKGTQNASLLGLSLKAGTGADVKVNTITLQGMVDTNNGTSTCTTGPDTTFVNGRENASCASIADITQTLKLWNGATQVGQTKSPSTSATANSGGLVTFDNLSLTVPAGQSLTLTLSGNLSSSLLTANLPDDVKYTVAGSTQVVATDVDGNTVVPSGSATSAVMRVADTGSITVTKAPDDSESEAGLVVGGSSNVVLAKFKIAAQNEEMKLSKARLNVNSPKTVSSLSLYDGSTLVGGPVSIDGYGNADFSGMTGFVIPKDGNKTLIVKGNMNTVGSSGATTGSDALVTLCDGLNDHNSLCNGGSGNPSADTSTFEARGTSAGSSTVLTSFATTSTASGTLTSDATLVADAATVVVGSVTYTFKTALTPSANQVLIGGSVAASLINLGKAINLTGVANTDYGAGTVINPDVTVGTVTATTLQVSAKSAGTYGNALTTTGATHLTFGAATLTGGLDGSLLGNSKLARRTKPTISIVALPTTTLVAGDNVVLRFTVSADAADNVALKGLTALINNGTGGTLTEMATTDSSIRRVGDASNRAGSSAFSAACTTTLVCTLKMVFASEEVVAAGTSRTYEVRVTAASAAAGNSITAKLLGDSTLAGTRLLTAGDATHAAIVGSTQSSFVWSDNSDTTSGDGNPAHIDTLGASSSDWANGLYVKVLPTDSQTLSK